ncbi:hypothetical protein [Xenorhabdus bovienii]|uniref:Uncharacterized protein n=1 Tax=Xenorhabdus bovienii str. kraussei Becker Underwood TaxID=1398204 RepID=A0A077PI97_XENBV|nr:hypothetical protein [Xenorhabdus bovienii]CDH24080.1 exported hypothetical protein [Xenorhabdus bovienii str. kraussei Becker Underwood]
MKKFNFLLIFIFIFTPLFTYAFVPVVAALLGQNLIRTGVTRVVASRALQGAANDAVYLTLVNNTRSSLSSTILNLAKNKSVLKTASGVATFALVAEQLRVPDVTHDIKVASLDKKVLFSDDTNVVNYRYMTGVGAGGSLPYLFSNDLDSLANESFIYDSKKGLLSNACIEGNCRFSNLRDLKINQEGDFFRVAGIYDIELKTYSGDWRKEERMYTRVLKLNPLRIDADFEKVSASVDVNDAKDKFVTAKQVADMVNALLMETSLNPDYKGIPVNTTNPVTEAEIKAALKTDSIPLIELLKPVKPYDEIKSKEALNKEIASLMLPDIKDENKDNNKNKEDDIGGEVKYPDLDMPTAEQIL